MEIDNRAYALKEFLGDTKSHKMEILMDNNVHRHLRFTNNGSYVYRFELITWPGYLCVCGDMGTFVFSRIDDMFKFFRSKNEKLAINPGYWAEKCTAGKDALSEYQQEIFIRKINEWTDEWVEKLDPIDACLLRKTITDEVLLYADSGEHEAMRAALDFEFKGKRVFNDFWECSLRDWTFQFVWICYAIVWGIKQYDKEH